MRGPSPGLADAPVAKLDMNQLVKSQQLLSGDLQATNSSLMNQSKLTMLSPNQDAAQSEAALAIHQLASIESRKKSSNHTGGETEVTKAARQSSAFK